MLYHNRTVRVAKEMLKGDKAIVEWQICTAILRYQLEPPPHWLDNPTFRQFHGGMVYLRDCSTGEKAYSKDGIKRAMGRLKSVESQRENNPGEGYSEAPARSTARFANIRQTEAVHLINSGKRKAAEVSGEKSSNLQNPRHNKDRTERDESTATLQGYAGVIDITSEDEDVEPMTKKPRKDAERREKRNPDDNGIIGQVIAAGGQHEVERQIVTETTAADMQQKIAQLRETMHFLPNIAASESKSFRDDFLKPLIDDIKTRGWADLVPWTEQLVESESRHFREHVAGRLQATLLERVNQLTA